MMNEQTIRQL